MRRRQSLLEPHGPPRFRFAALGIVITLVASAGCVLAGTWAMPASYVWTRNAISESAAQGVGGAWITRLGFLLFGAAVLWLAAHLRQQWARGVHCMHAVFGWFMIGTAAFSHRPWLVDAPFDAFEDFLHSLTATGMGFAFSFGVVLRLVQRGGGHTGRKLMDGLALASATLQAPLAALWPDAAGLVQRVMFAVAYLWYAHEATTGRPLPSRSIAVT